MFDLGRRLLLTFALFLFAAGTAWAQTADLGVSAYTWTPDPVVRGGISTFSINVTNNDPAASVNALSLVVDLPSNVDFSTVPTPANCAFNLAASPQTLTCSNTQGAFYDGDFHEFVAGAAYRPVSNDRWNTLVKYTNFYNLPSPGQLAPSGTTADYAQKSQVFSVDTIYDLLPWLSVGAKYGLRIGELQPTRSGGAWFSSRADLLVLRSDWH